MAAQDDMVSTTKGTPSCTFLSTDFGWPIFRSDSYALRISRAVTSVCEAVRDQNGFNTTEALCTQLREFARLLNLVPGKHGCLLPVHVDQLLDCILPLVESENTSDCLLEQLCKVILCKSLVVKTAKPKCNWRAITQRWSRMYAVGNKERGKFSMQAYTFTRNPLGLVNPLLNDVVAKLGVLFAPDSFMDIYNFFQPVSPPHKSFICSYFFMQSLLKNCHRGGLQFEKLLLDVFRKWELSFVLRQRSGMSCDLYFLRIIQIIVRPEENESPHSVIPLPLALRDVLFSRIFYGLNPPAGKGHSAYISSDGGSKKNCKVASASAATLVLLLPSDPDSYMEFFLLTISKVEHLLYPSNRNSAAARISKFICKFVSLLLRRMRTLAIDFADSPPLLSAAQTHRLVLSLSPTVLNALYYEDPSVGIFSRVSLFKMLYLDSLAIIPGIVKRVHSALQDGITSPHQTTAIISLANSLIRIILITAHPSALPDTLSSDLQSRFKAIHSYGTKEDNLIVMFQQSQEERSSAILSLDASGVATTKASFLRLIPLLLTSILPYVSSSNISMCNRALDFYCNFMQHAPLFELPKDVIKPLVHDILWTAIKDISVQFSIWSSAFLEQILFLASTVGAAHEQDASQVSSIANLKKALLLVLSHLPDEEWEDLQSPCLTRQRALIVISEFIESHYMPNDSPSMDAVVYAAVVSGDYGTTQRIVKFLLSKLLRSMTAETPSSPSVSGMPSFSFSGMVLGTKNTKELRFYTSMLNQVVVTCRDASLFQPFNLDFCCLMHCLLDVEDEEAFSASLELLYSFFNSQCKPLHAPCFREYRCVPESLWNNKEWRRVSYASWGRGVNEASSDFQCAPIFCNKDLIESLTELFLQRIDLLCSSVKLSSLALNNNLKIISTVLQAIRLYPRNELPPDHEVFCLASWRAVAALQHQQQSKEFPLFVYKEQCCSLKWWTVSALLLKLFRSLLSHAKDGIQAAASLCSICHVWYSKLTYSPAAYDSDLSVEVPRRLQRWSRNELARNWEAMMINFCTYNSNSVFSTCRNDIHLARELMQFVCHPVESVRMKANGAVESLCHSLGTEIFKEVVPFTLNIIKDPASPSCSFAGASLFLTLPSTTRYILLNWDVRCEVARALLCVHKRTTQTELKHEILFWAMECALWDFFLPSIELPVGEPDHPKALLADIDANMLELPSMHWSYAEMVLRIAEIFRMSNRSIISPSTLAIFTNLLPNATGPMLVTKRSKPYESVGCYDTIVQCINYALDHVVKNIRKTIAGPFAPPKFLPDSGWKTFSFNFNAPFPIQTLLDQRKKDRCVWLPSLTFSLDTSDCDILKIAESMFADAEVLSSIIRINISNFVPHSGAESGGSSANVSPSTSKICNITLFKRLTSLFGTACTDPILRFVEQVVDELGLIATAASADSVYLPRQLLASEMFAGVSLGIKYLPKEIASSIEQRLGSVLIAVVNHDSSLAKVEVMCPTPNPQPPTPNPNLTLSPFRWWSALAAISQDSHPLQISWLLEAALQPLSQIHVAAGPSSTSHPLCKRLRCARRIILNGVWGVWPLQLEFIRSVCLVAIHPSAQVRNCAIMCILAALDEVWDFTVGQSSSIILPLPDHCFFDLISRIYKTLPTLELNSPAFKSTKDFVIVLFKHAGGLPFRPLFLPMIRLMFQLISFSENDDSGCPLYEYIVAVSNLTVFSPAVVDSVIALCIEQCLSEKWHIRHAVSPVLEVLCFRHSMCILASRRLDVATSLSLLLQDPLVEVRKSATAALPSIFRICNHEERSHFSSLYMNWSKDAEALVKKKPASEHLTLRHAGVLGLSSLIQFEPFSVLEWMPALLERLAVHTSDPEPIKTSARFFFSQFWTTHRDSWHLYASMFDGTLLDTLMELFRGHRSYYL